MLKTVLTNPTFLSIVNGQLRHVGTIVGTALATNGFIGGSDIEGFAGVFVTLVTMLLSALSKKPAV